MTRIGLALAVALAALGFSAAPARAQVSPETAPERTRPGEEPRPTTPLEREDRITFVPLPVLFSDPNIGAGYGIMPVVLLHPERRIEWIFAPSVDYNQVVGAAFTSRVFFYPTVKEEFNAYNAVTTGPNMEHSAQFREQDRWIEGHSNSFMRGYFIIDATKRFFGFGSRTRQKDETDYRLREYGADGELGYRLWDVFRLSGTARYRNAKVGHGILDDLPDTVERFPAIQGVDPSGVDLLAFGVHAVLDLRDNPAIPSDGLLADAFFELSARGTVSETRYERWGAAFVHHLPVVRPRTWVSVVRGRYVAIDPDEQTPFWEYPGLGGAENLRGFGSGRYTGEQAILFGVEERFRFLEMIIRDNQIVLEIAPFVDAGRVFGRGDALSLRRWEVIPGVGGRLLLPDSSIVARLDIGYSGREGSAVFIVLGYPF